MKDSLKNAEVGRGSEILRHCFGSEEAIDYEHGYDDPENSA